jgi:hypothetical protein
MKMMRRRPEKAWRVKEMNEAYDEEDQDGLISLRDEENYPGSRPRSGAARTFTGNFRDDDPDADYELDGQAEGPTSPWAPWDEDVLAALEAEGEKGIDEDTGVNIRPGINRETTIDPDTGMDQYGFDHRQVGIDDDESMEVVQDPHVGDDDNESDQEGFGPLVGEEEEDEEMKEDRGRRGELI